MAAPTFNQYAGNNAFNTSGTSVAATLPSPVAQGDTLIAFIGMADNGQSCTVSSVTDSAGNTWTQVPNAFGSVEDSSSTYWNLDVWIATNVAGASSVTVTAHIVHTFALATFDIGVYDISAATVAQVFQTTPSSIGSSGTYTGPSCSSSGAALFLAGMEAALAGENSQEAPWQLESNDLHNEELGSGYLSESSGASLNGPTWVINGDSNVPAVIDVIVLTASSGNVNVPNVVGDTQSAAQTAITNAGLTVGTISSQSSNTVPSGDVISQNPAAGTSVASGSSVSLVVSTGPSTLSGDGVQGTLTSAGASAGYGTAGNTVTLSTQRYNQNPTYLSNPTAVSIGSGDGTQITFLQNHDAFVAGKTYTVSTSYATALKNAGIAH